MKDQAEELRKLAGTEWADRARAAAPATRSTRVIAISSGKGGVGKTNVVVNLGLAIAHQNRQVLILDADLGLANIDVVMGISPRFNLQHVIAGQKSIREIVVPAQDGVQVISGGSG
ncbi:MAG: AAA family ATPase, partial [Chloroflexota bacterium]